MMSGHPRSVRMSGSFWRSADGQWVQRYRCNRCGSNFSSATFSDCYWQRKRHMNFKVEKWLCSGVSQRRLAENLCVDRKTIARKIKFLAKQARKVFEEFLGRCVAPIHVFEFDDLETFEHTKCKPLAVTVAVVEGTRFMVGAAVSRIPCKGPLAEISRRKYGERHDERLKARAELFERLQPFVVEGARIKSDKDPKYRRSVATYFPKAKHVTYKGRKPRAHGYGELKKGAFDPLFALNHTLAMMRYNLKTLARKTWCTTKLPEWLQDRIDIAVHYHNARLWKKLKD